MASNGHAIALCKSNIFVAVITKVGSFWLFQMKEKQANIRCFQIQLSECLLGEVSFL